MYEVKATHRVKSTRRLACEIYPDVFVVDGDGVLSTYDGPANGYCPCDPVESEVDEVFVIDERQLQESIHWSTSIYRPRTWQRPLGRVRRAGETENL